MGSCVLEQIKKLDVEHIGRLSDLLGALAAKGLGKALALGKPFELVNAFVCFALAVLSG